MKYGVIAFVVLTVGLAAGAMVLRSTERVTPPALRFNSYLPASPQTPAPQTPAPIQLADDEGHREVDPVDGSKVVAPSVSVSVAVPVVAPTIADPEAKAPAVAEKTEWALRHEIDGVVVRSSDKDFSNFFNTNAATAFPVSLDGEEAVEKFVALSERTPHNVRWELEFDTRKFQDGWNKALQCSKSGFYLTGVQRAEDPVIPMMKPQALVVERSGTTLRYVLNNAEVFNFTVDAADRTPLKAASDRYNITITASKLFYRTGEEQSDPPAVPAAQKTEAKWQNAFTDSFSDLDAPKRVFVLGSGKVEYHAEKQALLLNSVPEGEAAMALHASLPGDVRVRFKALRSKLSDQVSIGLFFGNRGKFGAMDGYFAEWARGIAQLKRQGHVLKRLDVPTPPTADRWVNLELRRVGATITMEVEGKEVLSFTEAAPLADAEHDLCAFYVWSDQTLIRDVTVDRNPSDPIKRQSSDPATKANLIDGTRNPEKGADF